MIRVQSEGIEADLCDFFVKLEFKDCKFESPYSISVMETSSVDLKKGKLGCFSGSGGKNPVESYKTWLEDNFGSSVLPAFLIKGTKIFLEVKLDGKAELKDEQKKEFKAVLEKGYRIFVIIPHLSIKPRKISVETFECYEFGKSKNHTSSIPEIKELI